MIPTDKSEAVARGLREAFGVSEFEEISRITIGRTSSLVFRIVAGGSPYLLKLITRTEDPTRHYTSMRAAAEHGLAPRVLYTNVEDRISITDFVAAEPLPIAEALVRLPALLRRLHALPPFGRAPFNTSCTFLLNKGAGLDGFIEKFQAANLLPKTESVEFCARCAELSAVYPYDDAEMVPSHNDLFKPDNILFDGERVLLVDWEAAFLNDRYADLAAVANQLVTSDEEEKALLQEYFGAPPDAYQQARFHLMQQTSHLFYTMAFLWMGAPEKAADWGRSVPEFSDYQRGIWAGEIDLANPDVKVAYSRVHWERFLRNAQEPRYEEALRIVSERLAARA